VKVGKRTSADEAMRLSRDVAEAERMKNESYLKSRDIFDEGRRALLDFQAEEKKRQQETQPAKLRMEKPADHFQPDTLAAAGLFAGSSLVANPTLDVNRQQLEVLRKIETNTQGGMFQ